MVGGDGGTFIFKGDVILVYVDGGILLWWWWW